MTIGSVDNKVLKFWEPGAPPFEKRLEALKIAHESGVETSVSIEPMLDDNVDAVIEAVRPYVTHSIWIGLPTKLYEYMLANGVLNKETMKAADALTSIFTRGFIYDLICKYRDDRLFQWKDSIKKKAVQRGWLPPVDRYPVSKFKHIV